MILSFLFQVLLRGLATWNDRFQRDQPIHVPRGKKSAMPSL
jgi:hypothetical protein